MTRVTHILWPGDKVARFWRAVRAGRAEDVVYRGVMEQRYRELGERFSAAIIDKDYAAACALLAPWLREVTPPERLRALIEDRVAEMHEAWDVDDPLHPTECELDGNSAIRVGELRKHDRDVPAELTDASFRYWMSMQFKPAEDSVEFDAYFDLWAALVDHAGELRVGYLRLTDPD
ncbi:MAG: hypothetical protein ACM31C_01490 [Acidobacteriota bacterium]